VVIDPGHADRGRAGTEITDDATLAGSLKALDCEWQVLDAESQAVKDLNFTQFTQGATLPLLIVQEKGVDRPVFAGPVATGADVLAKVRGLRGK
jgi:hypothetical protein